MICYGLEYIFWFIIESLCCARKVNFKMPHSCGVVGCGHNSARDIVRFFRIPAETDTRGVIKPLKKQRRESWIQALHRVDLTTDKLRNMRICSAHFVAGKPSDEEDVNNPDWSPHVNMGSATRACAKATRKRKLKKLEESKVLVAKEDVGTVNTEHVGDAEQGDGSVNTIRRNIFNCKTPILSFYKCNNCNFKTPLIVSLRRHICDEAEFTYYLKKCWKCYFRTFSIIGWFIHKRRCRIKEYKCYHCPFETKSKWVFNVHVNEHNKKPFECDQCVNKFEIEDELKSHKFEKHPLMFECDKCAYHCERIVYLKSHYKQRHVSDIVDIKWHKCDHCGLRTKTKRSLRNHILVKHTLDENIPWLQCPQCSLKFKVKGYLRNHILNKHTPSKAI